MHFTIEKYVSLVGKDTLIRSLKNTLFHYLEKLNNFRIANWLQESAKKIVLCISLLRKCVSLLGKFILCISLLRKCVSPLRKFNLYISILRECVSLLGNPGRKTPHGVYPGMIALSLYCDDGERHESGRVELARIVHFSFKEKCT